MASVDISSYKQNLIIDIFNNKEIISALDCKLDGFSPDEPDTIIYRGLFPYLRIPETQTAASSYVLVDVDKSKINGSNSSFCDIKITIWVMTHQSLMQIKGKNGTRIDYIANELEKMLDGEMKYGAGVLSLVLNHGVILNENYQYRELIFKVSDIKQSAHSKAGRFT